MNQGFCPQSPIAGDSVFPVFHVYKYIVLNTSMDKAMSAWLLRGATGGRLQAHNTCRPYVMQNGWTHTTCLLQQKFVPAFLTFSWSPEHFLIVASNSPGELLKTDCWAPALEFLIH